MQSDDSVALFTGAWDLGAIAGPMAFQAYDNDCFDYDQTRVDACNKLNNEHTHAYCADLTTKEGLARVLDSIQGRGNDNSAKLVTITSSCIPFSTAGTAYTNGRNSDVCPVSMPRVGCRMGDWPDPRRNRQEA